MIPTKKLSDLNEGGLFTYIAEDGKPMLRVFRRSGKQNETHFYCSDEYGQNFSWPAEVEVVPIVLFKDIKEEDWHGIPYFMCVHGTSEASQFIKGIKGGFLLDLGKKLTFGFHEHKGVTGRTNKLDPGDLFVCLGDPFKK